MSWSRMAVKMFFRFAERAGHLGLERGFFQVAKALDLAEGLERGQVDRTGHAVDVARFELERRGGKELRQQVFVGSIRDLQPDCGSPLALAQGFFDRREQAALDLIFEDRQVAVAGDAKRHVLGCAITAEECVEPGADHVFQQHEPFLAVGFIRQWDESIDHGGNLEHGIERSRVGLE